ncbi:MAG: VUT family protein [Rivularia sp. ALOHA_DT_140]|nr:VUT family protein [Rivularia sp. ALOHA_DT_140]
MANYTATWFIPLPIFGKVAVGTLVFGVTFDQRDRLHHYRGRKAVYLTVVITAFLAVLESYFLKVPERIILASLIAIVIAEAADTEIYQNAIQRPWLERVIRSNAVSIPLDTIIFNCIAFAGVFSEIELVSIIFGETITKVIISGIIAFWKVKDKETLFTSKK